MDDLIADFTAECREMLEALGGEIVAWEASPDDRARLDNIFRLVHTVKGNCGFFDFPRLEALSPAAEDALADCRAGRRTPDHALVSAVLAVIDRIGEMIAAIEANEEFPAGGDEALITSLEPGAAAAPSTDVAHKGAIAAPRTIRLSVELLDRVMSGVSDMVLARNELARRLRESTGDVTVDGAFERLSGIIAEMRDAITRTRMQRIENLFVALPRMVRDLSGELNNQVLVSARQSGNQILIDIVDDGKGIDGAKLAEKAVSSGALTKDEAAALTPREQLALIFEAGLSTAKEVTAISGRGVGMDVVRSNVERIGGIVEVDSAVGRGTRMTLRVPLNLTIIPALTVSIGSQHFAIPRAAIEEIVRANGSSVTLERIGGAGIATIRGRRVPVVSLADVLGLESSMTDLERTLVVLKPAGGDLFALAVDRIHDHEELVVKPAAPAVMATGLYAGTTLAGDGSPILLFDPSGLAMVGGVHLEIQERAGRVVDAPAIAAAIDVPVLLFRGLDGARRALHLGVVDRIEEVAAETIRHGAGRLRVQLGTSILPLAGVAPGTVLEGKVRLFRLSDGAQEIGYAFSEVIDLMTIDHDVIPAQAPGQVSGVSLIGGEPAELLDAHWLFAEYVGTAPRQVVPLVCRLPADDPWMQNMLRPIVEAAGYLVVGDASDLLPDLVIRSDGQAPTPTGDARVLTLASNPEAADGDGRIYRYDRTGLMLALKSANQGSGR